MQWLPVGQHRQEAREQEEAWNWSPPAAIGPLPAGDLGNGGVP